MDSMLLTYIITAATGFSAVSSILYFIKHKKFLGRRGLLTTVASALVFIMGIIAIIKGIPITQLQYLIESIFK